MGNQESRSEESQECTSTKNRNFTDNTTPILTPVDPRSPSTNIARTPINGLVKTNIMRDVSEMLEDETSDKAIVTLKTDPRSPSTEFTRTPIVVEESVESKAMKRNKHLDIALKISGQVTPITVATVPRTVPARSLVPVNQHQVVSNHNKRKSSVAYLETNVDFTETNLDRVLQSTVTQEGSPKEMNECVPPVLEKCEDQLEVSNIVCNLSYEPIEDGTQTLGTGENETSDNVKNVTDHVEDFDKKLHNLIYEDDVEQDDDDNQLRLRLAKISSQEYKRTPLGNRNSNQEQKKQNNKLTVSDHPRKSGSRIPILKDKLTRRDIQCENTPPTGMITRKSKPSHWDANKTLFI